MSGGKGGSSSTQTSTNTTTPPAYLNSAYQSLVSNAQNTASTPYSAYSGQLVAPTNSTQQSAYDSVNNLQGTANPYLAAAAGSAASSQTPLWGNTQQYSPDAIQSYSNPYTNSVINSTMANIGETNAEQSAQQQGNAISNGAWGGDRAGVAAGELARQQDLASGQTLSQLENQGYSQAQGEFNTEQSSQLGANEAQNWMASQAANTEGNLGNIANTTSLADTNALLSSGNQQQAQQQAIDTSGYNQYEQALAYPYQQESWLSSILNGTGSVAGGTTTGSGTTSQNTSAASQVGGGLAGITGLFGSSGMFGDSGAFSGMFKRGGGVIPRHLASGGVSDPITDVSLGWIPKPETKGGHANFPGEFRMSNSGSGSSSKTPSLGNMGSLSGLLNGSSGGTNFSSGIDPLTGNNNATQNDINANFVTGSDGAVSPTPDVMSMGDGVGNTGSVLSTVGNSGTSGGGWSGLIDSVGDWKRGGGVIPRRAMGGGMSSFGSMSAAHHTMPRITLPKVPDELKNPKFARGGRQHYDDGGIVGGINGGTTGGVAPASSNQNQMTQQYAQQIQQMTPEKLQELAVRLPPGSQQAMLVQRALKQKQVMPNVNTQQPQQQSSSALQTPQMARGGRMNYAIGGEVLPDVISGIGDIVGCFFGDPGAGDQGVGILSNLDGGATKGAGVESQLMKGGRTRLADGGNDDDDSSAGIAPASNTSRQGINVPQSQKPDPWMALAQAGFATMAGTSANGWSNLAQGAEAGLKNWSDQKKNQYDEDYKNADLEKAAAQLSNEADYHKGQLSNDAAKLDEEKARDAAQKSYQQGLLGNDTTKTQNERDYQQGMLERGKWQPYTTTTVDPNTGLPVQKTMPFDSVTGEFGTATDGTVTHPSNRGDLQDKELRNRATIAAQKELQAMGGTPPQGETPEQYVNRRTGQLYNYYSTGTNMGSGKSSSSPNSGAASQPDPLGIR